MSQFGDLTKIDALRSSFDESFAVPQSEQISGMEDLLMIRIRGDRYALRMSELVGLHSLRQVVKLPARRADLLGLAGIRGRLVPVFSLPILLGYAADRDDAEWLGLSRQDEELALALGEFTGHLTVAPSRICSLEGAAREHLPEIVGLDSGVCALVSVASIVSSIRSRTETGVSRQGAKS